MSSLFFTYWKDMISSNTQFFNAIRFVFFSLIGAHKEDKDCKRCAIRL